MDYGVTIFFLLVFPQNPLLPTKIGFALWEQSYHEQKKTLVTDPSLNNNQSCDPQNYVPYAE